MGNATVVDALLVTLGLDTEGVDQGVDRVENKLSGLAATAAKALAVVGGVMALKSMAFEYIAAADAIGKFSDSLGVDIEDMQAWSEAAIRAGGSAEGFQGSVDTLTAHLAQLSTTGGGKAKQFFEAMGIGATDATGKVKPALTVMLDLADKFQGMSRAESLGLGKKLGLDPGTIMLLQSGRKAVEDLVKRQKELGVYTKEDAEIASKANDALADMGQAWRAFTAILMRVVVPVLGFLMNALTGVISWLRGNETFVLAMLSVFAALILAKVVPALIAWGAANIAALWPILLTVAALAAMSAIIAALIDDYFAWAEGGESLMGDLWVSIDEVVKAAQGLWQEAGPLLDVLADLGKVLAAIGFDLVIIALQTIVDWIGTLIRIIMKVKDLFVAVFTGDFVGALHVLQDIFGEIFGFIERTFERVIGGIVGGIKKIGSWLGFGGDDAPAEPSARNMPKSGPLPAPHAGQAGGGNAQNQTVNQDNRREANTSIGTLNVYAPGADPAQTSGAVRDTLNDYTSAVINADSGVTQ